MKVEALANLPVSARSGCRYDTLSKHGSDQTVRVATLARRIGAECPDPAQNGEVSPVLRLHQLWSVLRRVLTVRSES